MSHPALPLSSTMRSFTRSSPRRTRVRRGSAATMARTHARLVHGKLGNGPHGGAVLVRARKIVEKIAERTHAETRESLCSLLADAFYVTDICG